MLLYAFIGLDFAYPLVFHIDLLSSPFNLFADFTYGVIVNQDSVAGGVY